MSKSANINRMGALSFVNALPVYHLFQGPIGFELVYDAPAALNQAMFDDKLVVSPVSSAYYLRHQQDLVLMDQLSISSSGPVNSVLFLSPVPLGPKLLTQTAIYVPTHSETSIALLDYLLEEQLSESVYSRFQPYQAPAYQEALLESAPFLTIGDAALKLYEQGIPEGYYCYDLAQLWQDKTGLPFVFAVWVGNKQWVEQNPAQWLDLQQQLLQSRDRFLSESDIFNKATQSAASRCKIATEVLAAYFTQNLFYGLTAEHHQALHVFETILTQLDHTNDRRQSTQFHYPLGACS